MNIQGTKFIVTGLLSVCFFIGTILTASEKPNYLQTDARSTLSLSEYPAGLSTSAAVDRLQDDVATFDKTLNT